MFQNDIGFHRLLWVALPLLRSAAPEREGIRPHE